MEDKIDIAITILASLLTGGFILFFVENQHVERDVIDRFRTIMNPYYRKLSSYLIFVYFIQSRIRYADTKTDDITEVKCLTDELAGLGETVFASGRNISYMSANELEVLNKKINNIWYYYDKGWFVTEKIHIDIHENYIFTDSQIQDKLCEILVKYSNREINKSLLPDISGEFYTESWQPVSSVTDNYEYWQERCLLNKHLLLFSLILVMIILIAAMFLSGNICHYFITIPTVLSCAIFAFDLFQLNKLMKLSHRIFNQL